LTVVGASLALLLATYAPVARATGLRGTIRFGWPTEVFRGNYPCCYEPSIAVDRLGRVFVTDAAGDAIAVSEDGGAHFKKRPAPPELVGQAPAEPVLSSLRGQRCVCDAIVQVDPHGRLVYSTLGETGVQVAVSSDAGRSWSSNILIGTPSPDRQWIGFGPKNIVYAIWHSGAITTPPAYFTATSSDGGRTFGPPQPFLPGTEIFSVGPPVVDGQGRVYVPLLTGYYTGGVVGPAAAVAVSPGGGAPTFVAHKVAANPCFCGFPIAAVDPRGTVAVAFTGFAGGRTEASYTRALVSGSTDHGLTWARPRAWSTDQVTSSPWINLRGGRSDLVWYGRGKLILTRGRRGVSSLQQGVVAYSSPQTDFAHFAYLPDGRVIAVFTEGAVFVNSELP
jgi:hypothetical protein